MRIILLSWLCLLSLHIAAQEHLPTISIIIDDMGNHHRMGEAALKLPPAVSLAFLPYAPYTPDLAHKANQMGHDVLLHLPMESIHHGRVDPGGLTQHMQQDEFIHVLRNSLQRIPNVVGVNNHMGSRLTQLEQPMQWLMQELHNIRPMFFIDSRTTVVTIAEEMALAHHVPTRKRDVFLDNILDKRSIIKQLQRLIAIAKRNGSAIAIGHPHALTLQVLAEQLPNLSEVKLIPIKNLVIQEQP